MRESVEAGVIRSTLFLCETLGELRNSYGIC